jgi:hypothetical protein
MDDVMHKRQAIGMILAAGLLLGGCAHRAKEYGVESKLHLKQRRVWAVCPAVNLSGEQVDPILQADLLYQQLQQVDGLTVIPVNRTVEVFAALGIDKIRSQHQAETVCQALGCDALAIPTVTIYDPFDPPKLGASLSLMSRTAGGDDGKPIDPQALLREAAPTAPPPMPAADKNFIQVVGMFDAANGSTRQAVLQYAAGRNDPLGPMGEREYFQSMSRYCGFVYHALIQRLLEKL